MAQAKDEISKLFTENGKTLYPAVVCEYDGKTVSCIARGYVADEHRAEYPKLFEETLKVQTS